MQNVHSRQSDSNNGAQSPLSVLFRTGRLCSEKVQALRRVFRSSLAAEPDAKSLESRSRGSPEPRDSRSRADVQRTDWSRNLVADRDSHWLLRIHYSWTDPPHSLHL